MNAEQQSLILNKDSRGEKQTIFFAKTLKSKANIYNVYWLNDNGDLELLYHSADLTCLRKEINKCEYAPVIPILSHNLLGYETMHVRFKNLSE